MLAGRPSIPVTAEDREGWCMDEQYEYLRGCDRDLLAQRFETHREPVLE